MDMENQSMSKFEGRDLIVYQQLRRSHMAGNRQLPTNETELRYLVKNWSELLKTIPDGDLVVSFANAIINTKYTASVSGVIAGYSAVKSGEFNARDWQTDSNGPIKGPKAITRPEINFTTKLIVKYPQFRPVLERMSVGDQNEPPDNADHVEVCELVAGMFDGK